MIEPHIPLYLTLAFLLVAGNAFFVAAEFAIVKVRTTRIQEMVSSRLPGSRLAHEVVSNLDQYLSACQLGITMVSLGLGWVGEEAFTGLLLPLLADRGPYAVVTARTLAAALAFAIITALHIVLGELVPKRAAIRRPGRMARVAAPILMAFNRIFYPALWLLTKSADGILALMGIRGHEEPGLSEEELRFLFADSLRKGVITPSEAEIMVRATRFADRTARDVMVPLDRVVTWSFNRPMEENIALARAEKHTRYPVHDPHRNDLIGVINLKGLALYSDKDAQDAGVVKELLRVPEDRRIDAVLKEMRRRRLHMAAVVDRSNKAIGILTMEDIIEEIFGEIEDEFESAPPSQPTGPQGQGPAAHGAR
ncbi:MAG TPA: hemolysin family protein [Candidatus Polarisedimenticolia bacterium]|nr:hemolysin family protein [Candidatus Polarisedimenticolia bacterium]